MAIKRDGLEETVLRREIEVRLREVQRAASRGEPPVHWKAQRNEIDDLWSRLLKVQEARTLAAVDRSAEGDRPDSARSVSSAAGKSQP